MKIIIYTILGLFVFVVGIIVGVLLTADSGESYRDELVNNSLELYRNPLIDDTKLTTIVNQYKAKNKIIIPKKDESLCKIASMRLGMVYDDWSHNGFFENWTLNVVGNKYDYLYENLARGFFTPEDVLEGWINSPTHNEILLTNKTHMCIKCRSINFTNYCVLIGGRI